MNRDRGVWGVVGAVLGLAALIIATIALVQSDDGSAVEGVAETGTKGSGSASTRAAAVLSEFKVALDPAVVPAGAVEVEVTNEGAILHTLALEGADDKVTRDLAGAESATLALGVLEPGDYTLYCTIPGHRDAGMEATLKVTAATAMEDDDHGGKGAEPDYAALDRAMQETIKRFPAETEGVGGQVLEPRVLADGTKQFDLTAKIVDWEVEPGKTVEAWAYNGMVPGPTIKVDPGDRLRFVVRNELPMGTDVHFHGLRTPNAQDGVAPITQPLIESGATFTYEFEAVGPTVAMYHAHHHAQMQVPNGMLGTILVGQVPLPAGRTVSGVRLPESLPVSQEFPLVLNDAGTIGYSLNGKSFPATAPAAAARGAWILVHYLNEGLQIHPMHLHGMNQLVVAKDGIALDQPYFADTVTVAPGERYSVLVHADNPGTWVWHCHILNHVEREAGMFGMVTALVVE